MTVGPVRWARAAGAARVIGVGGADAPEPDPEPEPGVGTTGGEQAERRARGRRRGGACPCDAPRPGHRFRRRPGKTRDAGGVADGGQETVSAASSTTKLVCSEVSSVPLNESVTLVPATPDSANDRWV